MSVFFCSDIHLGHAKVASLRGFTTTDSHDTAIARNWGAVVKPDDQVWVLGDISGGSKQGQLNALEWIKERPGKKHLISGNHDSTHPMHRDSHKWLPIYLEAFDSVQSAAKRRIPRHGLTAGGNRVCIGYETVLMSHFPYEGDSGETERYPEWRLRDCDYTLLHGHTHASKSVTRSMDYTRQIHVGLDAWELFPISLDDISAIIEETP